MTHEQAYAIAQAVADDLFTNGVGDRAERLVLWRDSDKADLGGWCREAVVLRVKALLLGNPPPSKYSLRRDC